MGQRRFLGWRLVLIQILATGARPEDHEGIPGEIELEIGKRRGYDDKSLDAPMTMPPVRFKCR